MTLTAVGNQDLRHAVLHAFYQRRLIPITVDSVRVSVRRLIPEAITPEDVLGAVQFHLGLGNVALFQDPWGSEDMYKITSAGQIAYERDQNKIG